MNKQIRHEQLFTRLNDNQKDRGTEDDDDYYRDNDIIIAQTQLILRLLKYIYKKW